MKGRTKLIIKSLIVFEWTTHSLERKITRLNQTNDRGCIECQTILLNYVILYFDFDFVKQLNSNNLMVGY